MGDYRGYYIKLFDLLTIYSGFDALILQGLRGYHAEEIYA